MSDYFRKTKSLFSTTANTFGTGSGVTITPNSVTGLPTDTEIVLTFDRVDSAGTATPTKMERIIGTITGANFVVRTSPATGRGADGTSDAAHTSPVVEYIPNAKDMNDLVDGLLIAHAQTGIHKSGATYAAPVFSGSATGTYTLAGTPTITSPVLSGAGATAAGTLGYGATDHNLLVGDGTTNNVIHIGHWKAWTPTWTNLTIGSGTQDSAYSMIGKNVLFRIYLKFAANTSISGSVSFTLPVTSIAYSGTVGVPIIGVCQLFDAAPAQYKGIIGWGTTTTAYLLAEKTDGTYNTMAALSSTVTHTWATDDEIHCEGFYEAA